jgi:hypothetical protein
MDCPAENGGNEFLMSYSNLLILYNYFFPCISVLLLDTRSGNIFLELNVFVSMLKNLRFSVTLFTSFPKACFAFEITLRRQC